MKFKIPRKHLKFLSDWLDKPNNWNDGFDNHPRLLTDIRDIIYEQAYQTKIKRGMKGTKKCTPKQLLNWLYEHLDDCPADWEKDDFSGRDGTAVIFTTEKN